MPAITRVDPTSFVIDVHRDLSMSTRARKPGPPERIDGVTVGMELVTHDAPHGGEVHPDGDEILFVASGRVRVTPETDPDNPVELGPGQACIVHKGQWHRVSILEPTLLVHVTPGPRGDHRPLPGPR